MSSESDENNDCVNKMPCIKFIVTASLSIVTLLGGITLLGLFHTSEVVTPIASSMITTTMALWVSAPKIYEK